MTNQSTPASPIPIGSLIADKYRVERVLGKGGMGIVVAARHVKLDEPVAIKLMLNDDLYNRDSVERFLREARACAKLRNNEHIARVSDVDTLPNGLPYMVMELLDGRDFDRILKESGVFLIHDACAYLMQACRALGDAHQKGIIHRDLKPQNLFLTRRADGSPRVKVLDFGISKHTIADESASIDLTRPSDILGSAYYMSPEQARSSKSVVPQSDIYSMGAVLYKVLTGRAPFPKKTLLEVYEALLTESPVPPSRFRPQIPPELDAIILKCLDKTVERRFSTTHELMAALAPFTVPRETTKVDDTDSDSVTTLPRGRGPKLPNLSGTQPLVENPAHVPVHPHRTSGQSRSSDVAPDNPGIPFHTQPLDARSLHAALHEYLPPRSMTRPSPPSHPRLPDSLRASADAPTPRIPAQKVSVPAPLRDEYAMNAASVRPLDQRAATRAAQPGPVRPTATRTPLPRTANTAATQATVYLPSAAHVVLRSPSIDLPPSKSPESMILPWNAFPAVAKKSPLSWRTIALFGGAVAVLLLLLVLKFFS